MLRAQNPTTEEWFDLPEGTEVNEIIKDPNTGDMFEVVAIANDIATLEAVNVEEDWGE